MVAQLVPLLAVEAPSAGGAEAGQIAIVTVVAVVMTTALLVLGLGHRSGRIALLGRVAGFAERALRMPGWAALPLAIATPTLLLALFGLTWDESLHIDDGRDPGPLANPSHYFLLIGLFGIFTAGWLALVLPERGSRPGPASVRITRDWHVPVGGLLTMLCGSVALAGFPLDDVSHRLFGQDVSLWGTTHLQMLTGAATGVVGLCILFREGVLVEQARRGTAQEIVPFVRLPKLADLALEKLHYATLGGGLLGALSIFQGEYDFGVPQFRLIFHPILIAGMAAFALVAVRALAGPGAALLAAVWFIVVRGVITLLVGPVFGETVATFPLYLAEALIVEAVAVALVATKRPYAFGAVSGALIGSVGVLAGYGWSKVWVPLEWPAHMLPSAVALSVPVGIACGLLGAFLFCGLDRRPALVASRAAIATAAGCVVLVGGMIAVLRTTEAQDIRAAVTTEQVAGGRIVATVTLDPPDAAEEADWFHTLAYQGKGPLEIGELTEVRPGVYRTEAIPVTGTWKTSVRIHKGRAMTAMPIRLPADEAIPAVEVSAPAAFQRSFQADRKILQRERKDDVSRAAETGFAALILAICLGLIATLGRGLVHLGTSAQRTPRPSAAGAPRAARETTAA